MSGWIARMTVVSAAVLVACPCCEREHARGADAKDVDESFAGSAAYDFVTLANAGDRVLHNCTVLVELRGAAGDVAQNVHFVPTWEPGTKRFARYGIGVETPNSRSRLGNGCIT